MDKNSAILKRLSQKLFQKLLRLELNRLEVKVRQWLLCWDRDYGPFVKPLTKKLTMPYPLDGFLSELAKIPDGSGDKGLLSALMRIEDFPNSCSVFTYEKERATYWPRSTKLEVAMSLAQQLLWKELRRTKAPLQYWLLTWHDDLGVCVQKEAELPGVAFSFLDTLKAFSIIADDSGEVPRLTTDANIRSTTVEEPQWPEDTPESRVIVVTPA